MSKTVVVLPRVEGAPMAGFSVTGVTVDPVTVAVIGPKGALDGVQDATTEAVSVEGASATVTETVNVGVTTPSVRLRQARTVTVTVTIGPEADW
jgi:YbbR domain-containing protein